MGALAVPLITAVAGGVASVAASKFLGPKAPKSAGIQPQAPHPPSLTQGLASRPLFGASEGTANGTFLSGSNRTPILGGTSGGKKTLLGT